MESETLALLQICLNCEKDSGRRDVLLALILGRVMLWIASFIDGKSSASFAAAVGVRFVVVGATI